MSVLASFEIGFLIGIVLFAICLRKGLIQQWTHVIKQKHTSPALAHITSK